MRVPISWLSEWVDVPAGTSAQDVAASLVKVGLEEEAVHGGGVTGPLVVGRVLEFSAEPQKNGKTIRWCQVDVGEAQPRGIVCGAGNFEVGDLVVASLPGAVLPGGFAIAARRTYGHTSDGMICSARELGLGEDHAGIIRLGEWGIEATPGDDAIALLGLADQTVEVNVTPDRGYCFSVRGVAREYSHATGATFTDHALRSVPTTDADGFAVRLADDAPIRDVAGCDRYVARLVHDVDASRPSPRWMQRRLEQAGMRAISLAVDVTNYVMLALGQPLHAFDVDRLTAPIVVRRARDGERLTTLDDVERVLHPEDLLITDTDGERVLALAGVMGGASSEVSASTRNVLVEAAHFDPVTTARSARRHKLATEASRRFERGVDTDLAAAAADLAVALLVEHGGGRPGLVTDVDQRVAATAIPLATDLPARVVGLPFDRAEIVARLTEIGCGISDAAAEPLLVQAPTWRPDLRVGVDLVEELARLRGYDKIPSVLPVAPPGRGLTHGQRARRSVARSLAEHGLVEVLSYPFVAQRWLDDFGVPADDDRRAQVRLANPLSDEAPFMRSSLLPTLLDTVRRNLSRGASDLALFELGLVTRPELPLRPAPLPSVAARPSVDDLEALDAAVPRQPRRVAVVLTGNRTPDRWDARARPVDWADAVEAALVVGRALGLTLQVVGDQHAPWHPGRCARIELDGVLVGHAGELHPAVVAALGLPARTVAAELELDHLVAVSGGIRTAVSVSTYPVAKEDVALVVGDDVPAAVVEAALRIGGGELLEDVRLFDVYTGPQVGQGRRSLAFALRLRAADRTLTAAEVAAVREAAVQSASDAVGAVLRGA